MIINPKKRNIFYDIICIIIISLPSLVYAIPWILSQDPSLGIDHYGGDSILINKTFSEIDRGYISDWYIGANFALYPVRYTYWIILQILYIFSSNPITITKLGFLFTFFLSIVTSYATIEKIYNRKLYGMIGSLLYVYAPYHMAWSGTESVWSLSLYYAILPLAFYYFLDFVKDLNDRNEVDYVKLLISSLTLDLIIFTHPQSFILLAAPFFVMFSMLYNTTVCGTLVKTDTLYRNISSAVKRMFLSILPIMISFLMSAFWWTSAIQQKELMSQPINGMDIVEEKTPSFLSIIALQGRSFTFPDFQYFFHSYAEMFIAGILTIIIWVTILYCLTRQREHIGKKIYWVVPMVISSVIFILMSMGPISPIPIYTWLYYNVPFVSNIRSPDRWLSIVILCVSLIFPLGIEIGIEKLSRVLPIIQKNISKTRHIIYIFIAMLILANSWTELSYTFKDFKLNSDIYQYYDFLSSKQDGIRIFTVPPYSYYTLDKAKNNANDGRTPLVVDPRIWTFMYGKKENFAGGSEALSDKGIGEFVSTIRNIKNRYIVNLDMIYDVYGIDYVWIDKTKKESLRYNIDESITILLDTENYRLYHNNNSFPRIFALTEDVVGLGSKWNIAEGNGHMTIVNSSDSFLQLQINYSKDVGEWRYAKYENLTTLNMLDEIYGDYVISGIEPNLANIYLKFTEEDGKNYIWMNRIVTYNGTFKIPVFWFQPMKTNGSALNVDTIKSLSVGIIEDSSNIKSEKNGIVEIKNLKILRHKLTDVSYDKVDDLLFNIRMTNTSNSKNLIIFNYAYNPNIKLRIDDTFVDSYKIFGFLNAFDIPYSSREELKGTIEYKPGKPYYYGVIISLVTIISIVSYVLFSLVKNRLKDK